MLSFDLPPARDAGPVETRPKAVASWLAHLPYASPLDAAYQLLSALRTLNRHALDPDAREALLALYEPALARVAAGLETLLSDAGVPPHAVPQQAGVVLRELHLEHSLGYKHLLKALASGSIRRGLAKRAAARAGRLLAALYDVQFACHLTYGSQPAGLWRDMHQCFAWARDNHLSELTVDNAPAPSAVYRQALLMALADPPHMSRAEIRHARLLLVRLGTLARLSATDIPPAQGAFAVPVDSDNGPCACIDRPSEGSLWLETDVLCRNLHDMVLRLRTGDSPRYIGLPPDMDSETTQTLGKRLLKLWRIGTQRAFKRYTPRPGFVQMVAGVWAIHRLLMQDSIAPQDETASDDSLPIGDVETLTASPAVVHATEWSIRDDSAGGLALSGTPEASLNLKVGDVVALRGDDAAPWSLAVIRWIRMHDAQRVEFGAERLAPRAQPVWVRPLRGLRKTTEPALFVPGMAALKQSDRLLLPRHVYGPGMDAEVWHDPRQYTLTFGRRLEHTPSFDLIDFTVFE
jgi:hypothetical protein